MKGGEVVTMELIGFNAMAVDLALKMSDSVISGTLAIGQPGSGKDRRLRRTGREAIRAWYHHVI
jgi:hypothetical protein